MRQTIRETLARDTLHCKLRTFPIGNAESGAIVETEIKLCEIAVKMLFGAMLIRATHSALEH